MRQLPEGDVRLDSFDSGGQRMPRLFRRSGRWAVGGHWICGMVQHILTCSVVYDSKVAIIVVVDHPVE
jgi:hypothetical protein